jgi:sugar diacid utilization regulator
VAGQHGLAEVVKLYASISGHNVEVAETGPRVYVVLSAPKVESFDARRFATEAVRQASSALQQQVYAAIGPAVESVNGAIISRQQADRVMRVLLRTDNDWTVAGLDDVRAHAGLLEVLDLIGDRPHLWEGPLDRLAQEPTDRRAVLVDTLRAYLDHHGDVRAASKAMNVHANTFRYRLSRAGELACVDLADPTERLMLTLQLRLRS